LTALENRCRVPLEVLMIHPDEQLALCRRSEDIRVGAAFCYTCWRYKDRATQCRLAVFQGRKRPGYAITQTYEKNGQTKAIVERGRG
jgi:hypothetical protein